MFKGKVMQWSNYRRSKRKSVYGTSALEIAVVEQVRRSLSGQNLLSDDDAEAYIEGVLNSNRTEDAIGQLLDNKALLSASNGLHPIPISELHLKLIDDPPTVHLPVDSSEGSESSVGSNEIKLDGYSELSEEKREVIDRLASMFCCWEQAYDAARCVWDAMQHDNKFELDVLVSQIPVTYACYLREALKYYALE
jgi:hypothetical protein